jgi:hypothetical protein
MVKVLVFHYTDKGKLPRLSPEEAETIKKSIDEALQANPEVRLNGVFVNEEGVGVCDWEAPNAEVVEKIVKEKIRAPYDSVVAVEKLEL